MNPSINNITPRTGRVLKEDNTFVNEAEGINSDGSRNVQLIGNTLSPVVILQNAAAAIGVGTPLPTSGYGVASLAISGVFVATITFEGQAADGIWYGIKARQRVANAFTGSKTINASIASTSTSDYTTTVAGLYEINCLGLTAIRANITTYSNGNVTIEGQAQSLTPISDTVQIAGSIAQYTGRGRVVGRSADVTGLNDSEIGIGAIIPWAGKLWYTNYLANATTSYGSGSGLYYIDKDFKETVVDQFPCIGTARHIHFATNSLFIGNWKIDINGVVVRINTLTGLRVAAITSHITDSNKVYVLSMEGIVYEMSAFFPYTLTQLFNLVTVLNIAGQPHFKAAYTQSTPTGRLFVVTNNNTPDGRLAYWDGVNMTAAGWHIIDQTASWVEVAGTKEFDNLVFATGIDSKSAILAVGKSNDTTVWIKRRLPLPTRMYEQYWQQEWMRIRMVETEKFLMDLHGMFYQLQPSLLGGDPNITRPVVEPVSRHIRTIPDFTTWNGYFVIGGNEATPQNGSYRNIGQPSSGMVFMITDDLWSWGKPIGYGDIWQNEAVTTNIPSDEFLMNGFDKKAMHINNGHSAAINFKVEVCHRDVWYTYQTFNVAAGLYFHHEFPSGFGAEWVRVTPDISGTSVSCWFVYS